jgi:hypothetical protein
MAMVRERRFIIRQGKTATGKGSTLASLEDTVMSFWFK